MGDCVFTYQALWVTVGAGNVTAGKAGMLIVVDCTVDAHGSICQIIIDIVPSSSTFPSSHIHTNINIANLHGAQQEDAINKTDRR